MPSPSALVGSSPKPGGFWQRMEDLLKRVESWREGGHEVERGRRPTDPLSQCFRRRRRSIGSGGARVKIPSQFRHRGTFRASEGERGRPTMQGAGSASPLLPRPCLATWPIAGYFTRMTAMFGSPGIECTREAWQ